MPIKRVNTKRAPRSGKSPISTNSPAAVVSGLLEDVRAYKRELIIHSAIEIFYRNGYQSATVDGVAAAMSVTKAVVYYHFKSKDALLQAIIERCSVLTSTAIDRGIADGKDSVQQLALASFHYAAMILDNQKMIALYFREERSFSVELRERLTATERAVTSKLARVIDSGIRRGDFRACDSQLLALNITGMISMAFYWTTEHGRLPLAQLCRLFAVDALNLAGYAGDISEAEWLPRDIAK
jgi:AcrR family transcriptional regulator